MSGMRAGGGNLGRPFFLLLAFLPFCSLKYIYFIVFLNVCQPKPVGQDRHKTTDEAKRRGQNTGGKPVAIAVIDINLDDIARTAELNKANEELKREID